jgi:hypothetical protein
VPSAVTSALPPNTNTVPGTYSASAVYFSAKSAYCADVALANIVLNVFVAEPILATPLAVVKILPLISILPTVGLAAITALPLELLMLVTVVVVVI